MNHASIFRGIAAFAAATALLGAATAAAAHAHLVSSLPAADAAGPAPKTIVLTFSEKLEKRFSGAELSKDGAPLGSHGLLEEKEGKVLTLTPNAPLSPGSYKVSWHAVSVDGHRTKGDVKFAVR
jgi:methionine-rich copper-binding protein CopC